MRPGHYYQCCMLRCMPIPHGSPGGDSWRGKASQCTCYSTLRDPCSSVGAGTSIGEVDSVLSTLEVQQMLDEQGCLLAALPEAPTDSLLPGGEPQAGPVLGYPGGAGGYLEFVFR